MPSEMLLVELVTEELPPKALKGLGAAFVERVVDALAKVGLTTGDRDGVTGFASPRRLAVLIPGVLAKAADRIEQVRLMPAKVAFDGNGRPTPALMKRLDKEPGGATALVAHVKRVADAREEYAVVEVSLTGASLQEGLQAAVDDAIGKLPIPKLMSYQRPDGTTVSFARPVHRLVALHGSAVVPIRALGLQAGRTTSGHRFLSRGDIDIASAEAYVPTLEAEGKVLPSFEARRQRIVAGLATGAAGAKVIMPESLLDEVTALVEWPKVYTGGFDVAFLDVPQECLVLTMQQNQKYFAISAEDGGLENRFLLVANLDAPDPEPIVRGNERVLKARLADAKFFYDHDRRERLESRLPRLEGIVYNAKLGREDSSQAKRVARLAALAKTLAPQVGAEPHATDRAALLAKADLLTDMVGEFPELQGTMGRYYALHDGESNDVADAIAQHYWPRFAGDALPSRPVAQTLALADKLELLAGMFGLGERPTGDRDPFGLRRAAIGVLRILMEKRLTIELPALVRSAFAVFAGVPAVADSATDLEAFFVDRLRVHLRDQSGTANEVEAVLSPPPGRIDLVPDRLAAVRAFTALPEAEALASANKRIVNILKKSESEAASAVDRSLLGHGAEHDLYVVVQKLLPVVRDHVRGGEYTEALRALASARASVDRFFDSVLVMAEDHSVRANRLALLRGLAEAMNQVADISKLVV